MPTHRTPSHAPQYLIYLRKSRKDRDIERESGHTDTLQRHRDALLALARARGYAIAHIYEEVVSGDTIAERPEMQKLLSSVETGLYAGVLVMEIPRLARGNTRDQGVVAETFQYTGTKIITPDKTYNPADEADEEYFEFGLFMSRREYKAINRRQQRGRIASLEEGKYIAGTPPYGYEKVRLKKQRGWTLEVVPAAAEVVRLIFDLYTVGELQTDGTRRKYGSYTISNRLNERGIPAPSGKKWSPSAVKEILNNPTYAGYVRWGYRASVKRMEDGVVIESHPLNSTPRLIEGLHEPIITRQTWETTRSILASRSHAPVPINSCISNPVAGILICSVCGRSLVGLRQRRGNLMLHCPTPGCSNVSSTLPEVERSLLDGLRLWLAEYEIASSGVAGDAAGIATHEKALFRLNGELTTLQQQQDNLFDLLEQGVYNKDRFLERSRNLSERITAVTASITETKRLLADERALLENRRQLIPNVKRVLAEYPILTDPAEKNGLLKEVLRKAVYTKTKGGRWAESDLNLYIFPRVQTADNDI